MSEMHFSDNFNDLCQQSGPNAGFQFEFYCENCNDTWRSAFVPFRSGQAVNWLGRASGFMGGIMGEASSAVEGYAEAAFGKSRDKEFSEAVEQAKGHFHRCARCQQYVCGTCWNASKGLCLSCAPSVESEIAAAQVQGEIQAATEAAVAEGAKLGARIDVKRDRQLVCPDCGARTEGAKFCPDCGRKLAVAGQCPACGSSITPGVKFCPECGQKQ